MMSEDWTMHWKSGCSDIVWKIWARMMNRNYRKLLKHIKPDNQKILELGAGSGVNSITISDFMNSNDITLVDFNEKAIQVSKKLLADSGKNIKYLNKDIFNVNLNDKFDIVHSEGLIEHFYGSERLAIFKKHIDFCKKGGFIIIFVPYKSIKYDFFRWLVTKLGKWIWDEEPLSKEELHVMSKQLNQDILCEYSPLLSYQTGILIRKK